MSKPPSKFRLSFKANAKQIIIIVVTLIILALIPILISILLNPDNGTITERVSNAFNSFELKTEGNERMLSLPLTGSEVNVSLFSRNPQLVIFIGIGLILISIVIIMTLMKRKIRVNQMKKKLEKEQEEKKNEKPEVKTEVKTETKEEVKSEDKTEDTKNTLPPITSEKSTLP